MFIKRGSLRCAIEAKITFKLKESDSKLIEGQIIDLGNLGLSIFSKESVPVNTIVQFDLSMGFFKQHLIGEGKIVNLKQQKTYNSDGFRIGVAFTEIDNNILIEFINESHRRFNDQRRKIEEDRKKRQGSSDIGLF